MQNNIPPELKEVFEEIYYGIVGTYPDSYDLETMQQAYNLALSERWVDVKTPPENEDDVLICREDGFEDWTSIGNYVEGKFYNVWDWNCECSPTAWMPLPKRSTPPQTKD